MLITIDNKQYEAFEGETVLLVARRNGIYIPTLCYHVKTGQLAKCRVCLVSVEGMRGYLTSCNLNVREGMKVTVNSSELIDARRMVVDLVLSSGRHDCLSCQQNAACELQDVCYKLGIERPFFQSDEPAVVDSTSEFVSRDDSKCIKCNRCVEGCNKHVVNEVLDAGYRGKATKIICDQDLLMGTSSCVQCGECVQLCPTGAIIDKRSKGLGRSWQVDKIKTICPYCGVGCTLVLHVDRKTNKIVQVSGDENSTVNNGMLCVKGRYGFDFVGSPKRLTKPLIKNGNGTFDEVSWETAFSYIAERLISIKKNFGSNAIAGFASAKVTNEENYLFQKFIRKEIGTNNVDHCARLCHASTVAGLAVSFGSGAMTNDINNIDKADVILVIGSDTTAAHPIIGSKIKQAVRHGNSKLIVIDPKKIALAKHANIYARQRCGSDVAVLNGIMHIILKNGWQDQAFIDLRCEGFDAFAAEVDKYNPELVEKISGIPAEQLYAIAMLFGTSKVASIFYSMGITQHTTGVDNVMSVANLQMICGNLGVAGGGVNALRGQNNVQGACDMGSLPNVYPAYQKVDDPVAKEKFEKAWQASLSAVPGLTITEVLDAAIKGSVKALYVMGENPSLSDPDQTHAEKALESLELLIVQDIFLTETAQFAHVVLPSACFAEKDGTFTNTERRVQLVNKAVSAPGEALSDIEIICGIAKAMGGSGWDYIDAHSVYKEASSLAPSYAGITWDRIRENGIPWPCPTIDHPGTPVLHKDKFVRGKGFLKAIAFKEPAEMPDSEYPLTLTTGRLLFQFHTGTMTRKSEGLNQLGKPMVLISCEDACINKISDGDMVAIQTRRGRIEIAAEVTANIGVGTIFVPFHFAEAPANRLTIGAVDPIAKIPEFKVCAARIEKLIPVSG